MFKADPLSDLCNIKFNVKNTPVTLTSPLLNFILVELLAK